MVCMVQQADQHVWSREKEVSSEIGNPGYIDFVGYP
jgi:hypothetical protein